MDERPMFEVSAAWMKACGKGDKARVFPVIESWDAGLIPFAKLDMGDGTEWVVITSWRGRYV